MGQKTSISKQSEFSIWQTVSDWFISLLPEVEIAKSPLEAHDRRFYNSLMMHEFDEVSEKILAKPDAISSLIAELRELDFTGAEIASPFLYFDLLQSLHKQLVDLKHTSAAEAVKKLLIDFEKDLSIDPSINFCLGADLILMLEEWHRCKIKVNDFMDMLAFYQRVVQSDDYYIALSNLKSLISEKRVKLEKSISQIELKKFDIYLDETLKLLQKNTLIPQLIKKAQQNRQAFTELPLAHVEDIEEEVASWPPEEREFDESYILDALKLIKRGINFSLDHPVQALTLGLYTQVVAAAAFSSFPRQQEQREHAKRISNNGILSETLVNTPSSGNYTSPFVVNGPNGEFTVLFSGPDGFGSGIFGVAYSKFAQALRPQFQLNNITSSDQTAVAAIFQNNEYRLVWQSTHTGVSNIMYSRYDINWNQISPETILNTNVNAFPKTTPRIAANTNGGLAVWADSAGTHIVGRAINLSGLPQGTDQVFDTVITFGTTPTVTGVGSNFFSAWKSSDGSGTSVNGCFKFANNTNSPDYILSSNTANDQLDPVVTSDGTKTLIVFQSNAVDSSGDIFGRFATGFQQFSGNDFRINSNTVTGTQSKPTVTTKDNGNHLITFQSGANLFGQEITNAGVNVGSEIQINTFVNGTQINANSKSFPTGDIKDYVVAWANVFNSVSNIMLRVFNNTSLQPPVVTTASQQTTGTTSQTTTDSQTTTGPQTTTSAQITTDSQQTTAAPSVATTGIFSESTHTDSSGNVTPTTGISPAPNNNAAAIGGAIGGVTLLGLGIGLGLFAYKRYQKQPIRKNKKPSEIGNYFLLNKLDQDQAIKYKAATKNIIHFPPNTTRVEYKPLGSGQFGKIKLAQHKKTGNLVAVKKIKGESVKLCLEEAIIHKELSKEENILPLLDYVIDYDSQGNQAIYEFLPIAGFGSGESLLQRIKYVQDEDIKQKILIDATYQLVNGLEKMHAKKKYHCDIKPTNFLFDFSGNLFISDFGCTVASDSKMIHGLGDTRYYSPDHCAAHNVKQNFNGELQDIWGAGVAILEIAQGTFPFDSMSQAERFKKWSNPEYFQNIFAQDAKMKNPPKNSVYEILKEILNPDPTKRLNASAALKRMKELYKQPCLNKDQRQEVYKDMFELSASMSIPIPTKEDIAKLNAENYQRIQTGLYFANNNNSVDIIPDVNLSAEKSQQKEIYFNESANSQTPKFGVTPMWQKKNNNYDKPTGLTTEQISKQKLHGV